MCGLFQSKPISVTLLHMLQVVIHGEHIIDIMKPNNDVDYPARQSTIDASMEAGALIIENMLERMLVSVHQQLDALDEARLAEDVSSEAGMKRLISFFKTIQGAYEMVNRANNNNDKRSCDSIDIVEFRRELERHIKAIEEEGEDEDIH